MAALAGLLAPGVARLLGAGTLGWIVDLASHWVWLWWPLGLLGLLLVAWRVRWRLLAGAAVLGLPWAWLPPAIPASGEPPQVRVVAANVFVRNVDPGPLLSWAAATSADLIAVTELSPGFVQALPAASAWPHRHLAPRGDAFGVGLLSRWPLRQVRVDHDGGGIPHLRALVETPAGEIEVIVVHPVPPRTPHWHAVRHHLFASLAPRGPAPALMLGDFNSTPWSSAMRGLVANGWRWDAGIAPTWPAVARAIPIDMVWTHGPWQLSEREVGPAVGSDHLPVRAGLRWSTSPR